MSDEKPQWPAYIKELLRINGWSQAQLAEELGVAQCTVSKYMAGSIQPGGAVRKQLIRMGNL
jgi:transcriptional regulator with XRE-family HTH domain